MYMYFVIERLPEHRAKQELLDYIHDECFTEKEFNALFKALKDPQRREDAKEILLKYNEERAFSTKAVLLLVEALKDEETAPDAKEIFLKDTRKNFLFDSELEALVEALKDCKARETAKEILLKYLQEDYRWHEKVGELLDYPEKLDDPDLVDMTTKIIIRHFNWDYPRKETEVKLVEALKDPKKAETAKQLLMAHIEINKGSAPLDFLCEEAQNRLVDELTDRVVGTSAKKILLKLASSRRLSYEAEKKLVDCLKNSDISADVKEILLIQIHALWISEDSEMALVSLLDHPNALIAATAKELLLAQVAKIPLSDETISALKNSKAVAAREILD